MRRRGRPLMAAAVVGGTAYVASKKGAQAGAQQAQEQAPPDPGYDQAPPAEAAPAQDPYTQLAQLKSLLDQGILTQAEFDLQKQKILMTM